MKAFLLTLIAVGSVGGVHQAHAFEYMFDESDFEVSSTVSEVYFDSTFDEPVVVDDAVVFEDASVAYEVIGWGDVFAVDSFLGVSEDTAFGILSLKASGSEHSGVSGTLTAAIE